MKIVSYVLEDENQIPLDEYIQNHQKEFSTNQKKIKAVINIINSCFKLFKVNLKLSKTNIKQRTSAQNRAYWLWLIQIVELLEKEGIYAKNALGGQMDWTKEVLHYTISHNIIFKEYGKTSTSHLNTDEINLLIDRYVEMFSEIGVTLPEFPNEEGMLFNKNYG